VLITHSQEYTDSFILLIKATVLFGRVTDFNVRSGLRSNGTDEKNEGVTKTSTFINLDKLVTSDFITSLPPGFRNPIGGNGGDGSHIDTDLYLVHLLPHALSPSPISLDVASD